jgi:steroid 5-alpha reductase family enzyme
MDFLTAYLVIGLVILILMTLLWLASLALKNSSIVDIFWGAGFVISAWAAFALTPEGFAGRKWLLVILTSIWGLRLTLHILTRNWGKGEDFRYQVWRKEAGAAWWWRSFFKVFLLQGILMWIIATPLLRAQISATPTQMTFLDYLAIPVWLVGFFFEAMGDWQLARFKANPANKGKVLNTGVWRYTRHPNYFGDAA